jgi:cell division protein FtsB
VPAPRKPARTPAALALRVALALVGVGVLVFAVQGGEWGTTDLIRQSYRLKRVKHEVDSLSHEVDSLKAYKKLLATDPITQEKIAREEFGMVKGKKELLYRFTEPDSGRRKPDVVKKP